jgi:hypothetical protein
MTQEVCDALLGVGTMKLIYNGKLIFGVKFVNKKTKSNINESNWLSISH